MPTSKNEAGEYVKGPRSRHKFNVQRVWECPQCKKRVFAPPQVVTRACECRGKDRPTWMCLIELAASAASAAGADAPSEP